MALNLSALAADDSGYAVSVQACGGNKIKLQKGTAVFKDVKITAEEAGDYVLRIASGSRKVGMPHTQYNLCTSCNCVAAITFTVMLSLVGCRDS